MATRSAGPRDSSIPRRMAAPRGGVVVAAWLERRLRELVVSGSIPASPAVAVRNDAQRSAGELLDVAQPRRLLERGPRAYSGSDREVAQVRRVLGALQRRHAREP